jgi:serine/threonine-protein kinase HipA
MKLAMAVGVKRHYQIDDIVARHFLQSGLAAGLGEPVVRSLFLDLLETGPSALEQVIAALPEGFPMDLAVSVSQGFLARLKQLQDV